MWWRCSDGERSQVWLGTRRSEGFGLKWQDLDFSRDVVTFGQGFVSGRITRLKTEASRMEMSIPAAVKEALLDWKENTPIELPVLIGGVFEDDVTGVRAKCFEPHPNRLLFDGRSGLSNCGELLCQRGAGTAMAAYCGCGAIQPCNCSQLASSVGKTVSSCIAGGWSVPI